MGDREIALIEDPAERDAMWEEYYFSKWGMLANRKRQSIVEAFWNDPGVAKIDELLKDNEVCKRLHNNETKDFFSIREIQTLKLTMSISKIELFNH